jgi:hypothetical protein
MILMNIENQFEKLKIWASEKNILMVEGDYEQNKAAIVEIRNNNENSFDVFKQIIEKLNVQIIIYDLLHFDTETFKLYGLTVDKLEDTDIKEKFEKLKIFENKLFGYSLIICNEGMTFRFGNYIDETDIYLEVQSVVLDYIEDNDSENIEDSKYKNIPKDKIIELAKQFAEHENYSKLKQRTQRENFSKELFKVQFEQLSVHPEYGAVVIVANAETYYETVVKPKKEKELKLKIRDLLNKGWTKVRIAAELEISKDTLNKYC